MNNTPFLGRVGLFDGGCFISRDKVLKKLYIFCFNSFRFPNYHDSKQTNKKKTYFFFIFPFFRDFRFLVSFLVSGCRLYFSPLLRKDICKYIILFLGKSGKKILNEALKSWKFDYEEKKSLTSEESIIVKISNLRKKNV